jgi:SAM-dependent methyltransferase
LVRDFFQRWIPRDGSVLDVGAGFCTFINQVRARRKVAVDANPEVAKYCAPDVQFVETDDLASANLGEPFDVVFVSNFLEHLESLNHVLQFLADVQKVLTPDGRLIILQPNFALIGPAYFNFIDHSTVLTDTSLTEGLNVTGYEVLYLKRRFLPYTVKSKLPSAPWLVWLYLRVPIAQYILGKQSLIVATPRK